MEKAIKVTAIKTGMDWTTRRVMYGKTVRGCSYRWKYLFRAQPGRL